MTVDPTWHFRCGNMSGLWISFVQSVLIVKQNNGKTHGGLGKDKTPLASGCELSS